MIFFILSCIYIPYFLFHWIYLKFYNFKFSIKFIYLFVIFLNMVIETWEKDVLNLLRKDKRGIYIYIGEKLTIGFDL